jgi:hypothetical protein
MKSWSLVGAAMRAAREPGADRGSRRSSELSVLSTVSGLR